MIRVETAGVEDTYLYEDDMGFNFMNSETFARPGTASADRLGPCGRLHPVE